MDFLNVPANLPQNIIHKSFYSNLYKHALGYTVFLPPGYETSEKTYPVWYHLHGWMGDESSEVSALREVYGNREAITVFPNSSPVIENFENLPVEAMLIHEFIPLIDQAYRTDRCREGRGVSGFSMGGGMAFYCAVKYPELFSSVTAYAGTYHHYLHPDYSTVGEPVDQAAGIYETMVRENQDVEKGILSLLNQNAQKLRANVQIELHVGTKDVLYCENEILHLHLSALNIPHAYQKFPGAGHELEKILL